MSRLKICTKEKKRITLYRGYTFNIREDTLPAFEYFMGNGEMSKEMSAFIKLTKDKRCLLDIGALYGVFSLAFTCHNHHKIAHAIEPSPLPFSILSYHAKINPQTKIKPYKTAFSSFKGTMAMQYEWQHLVKLANHERRINHNQVKIHVTTVDTFLKKYSINPDTIKIDTEGSEFDILNGAKDYLLKNGPLLFLEIHTAKLKKQGVAIQKLESRILSLGYKMFDVAYNEIVDLVDFSMKKATCRIICNKELL
jgi:FkbM family methyltransferase